MDTTDPNIEFDEDGVCNHCRRYFQRESRYLFKGGDGQRKLRETVEEIKARGEGQQYDCVLGVSGGVDSSYVAYLAHQQGLRPYLLHLDNLWDDPRAVHNVQNIADRLGFELHNHVVDWDQYRDIQLAYLRASVVDIEAPTDHAIVALQYQVAGERGIKYLLTGSNFVSEGIMVRTWVYSKNDLRNIKDIHRRFGTIPIRDVPTLGLVKKLYYQHVKGIRSIPVLNYVPYIKKDVKKLLAEEVGWQDYGPKHFESTWTRFYQAHILPTKFGIDKRKCHFSTLICSGQMTRDEALKEMEKDPYAEADLQRDMAEVLEKLELTQEEFDEILRRPIRSHHDYKTDAALHGTLKWLAGRSKD